jgi:hypothetical protein
MHQLAQPFRPAKAQRGRTVILGALFAICIVVITATAFAQEPPNKLHEQEWVQVAIDNRSFVLERSGRKFVPWGFNYDHDGPGRLIEDYWDDEWPMVVEDFREMKALGATVVRIHLQFGKFMRSPDEPNQHSLGQLGRLVKLAEQVGLYLDLTGLGCYHKEDVPSWYDSLEEEERWAAQATFWEAVAEGCADSPAIFCYDLLNEPVVGGAKRDDWLGPAFAGKHFVQFIVLETKSRPRHEIARQWISQLVAAIRKHDQRHLVTVGLVHWSLDRPGLTSGFVPEKIADDLDFIAMHIYPEKGKVDEALGTVRGFAAVGKPVVIEETFPLKCSQDEMSQFIDGAKSVASGWISFYWGKTPEECRKGGTIGEAIMANWLELFPKKMIQNQSPFKGVVCEGTYRHHLQGICTNDRDAIYWSFTTTLVKTDTKGKVLKQIPVGNHHGDLCHVDGKIYVAVNFGRFNDPKGYADSWVYVYDADDLSLHAKHETQEVFHGAGGIEFRGGHFFVVGGLPDAVDENYVYEYDGRFKFVKKHVIESGHTHLGIQTAAFANGQWWFGCYGDPKILLVTDADFRMKGRYEFDCSLGIVGLPDGHLLSASGRCEKDKGCWGSACLAGADDRRGLITINKP